VARAQRQHALEQTCARHFPIYDCLCKKDAPIFVYSYQRIKRKKYNARW